MIEQELFIESVESVAFFVLNYVAEYPGIIFFVPELWTSGIAHNQIEAGKHDDRR
jgi:hypothetical protein